jgi:CHAD domain-containing protein
MQLSVRPLGEALALATAQTTTPPGLVENLPTGRLRTRLAPVVEMRALLPVATVDARSSLLEVRNGDDKIVVRVAVDELRTDHGTDLGVWVRIVPVRGYDRATGRARAALDALGATPAESDVSEAAVAASGRATRQHGDYSSKLSIKLDPDQSAASAFLTTLLVLLDAIEANLPGTLEDVDSEFLHDLRVAVRRSRSALKHARGVLPTELLDCFRPELAWLQEITGPTRDLDVQLLSLPDDVAGFAPEAAADLEPFAALLAATRKEQQAAMAEALRSSRTDALLHDWRETLVSLQDTAVDPGADEAGEWGPWPDGAARPIWAVVTKRAVKRHRQLLHAGSAIDDHSPAEALHDLRKQGKELRYLFELFGSLFPKDALAHAIKDLKWLQDNLGEFQDTEVQRLAVRAFAEELVERGASAGTVLTMAQLVQRLTDRQQAAREAFAGRFGRFSSKASRARFDALIGEADHR